MKRIFALLMFGMIIAKSLMNRITASYEVPCMKATGNTLLEHTFLKDRDAIDVIINLGFQYCLIGNLLLT